MHIRALVKLAQCSRPAAVPKRTLLIAVSIDVMAITLFSNHVLNLNFTNNIFPLTMTFYVAVPIFPLLLFPPPKSIPKAGA